MQHSGRNCSNKPASMLCALADVHKGRRCGFSFFHSLGTISMKYIAFIAIGCLLVMAGCSSSEAWSDALNDTAPPDPNLAHPQSRDATTSSDAARAARTPHRVPPQTQTPVSETAGPQLTQVSATLEGYPSCHVGAVRFYVNRRYKGQFDDEGKLTLEVEPGQLTLEVWDSGGHWLKTVNVQDGQTIQVVFGCGEKATNVRGVEGEGEGEEG